MDNDVIITCTNPVSSKIRKDLQSIKIQDKVTIFKVPSQLDHRYFNACRPTDISIGPYHRGKPELEAMEVHKLHYLQMFLERITSRLQLEEIVEKMAEMERPARSCYSDPIVMDKDEFVEMMILDGCFIIELMLKLQPRKTTPIISTRWKWLFILRDLLALENQLPFFVLEFLYTQVTNSGGQLSSVLPKNNSPTSELIENLFSLFSLSPTQLFTNLARSEQVHEQKPDHLLHLFQLTLSQCVSVSRETSPVVKPLQVTKRTRLYRRAVELDLSGVKFKTKDDCSKILDVRFSNGVLEMSLLIIDEHSDAFLRNFVALEQCGQEYGMHFTSYLNFIAGLVDSKEDVELLVKKGILHNSMGSNEDIVKHFFNRLCTDTAVNHAENHLSAVLSEIGEYCKPTLRKWKVMLLKDYFSSPWSILSFLAAVLLLVLTMLQASVVIIHYANHRP